MLIKITAKVYGHREGGQIVPKRPGDAPFEVDEKTAERLIQKEVAELVEGAPNALTAQDDDPPPAGDPLAYDDTTTLAQLKEIAAEYGADASACRKKAEAIAVIEAAKAAAGADEGQDDDAAEQDDEAPPVPGAAEPVS